MDLATLLYESKKITSRIAQLQQVMEALRYTDREELVKNINTWKAAWERRGVERDDLEERMQALLEKKEQQVHDIVTPRWRGV